MRGLFQPIVKTVARCFPQALFYQPTIKKQVALTIDDVPVPERYGFDNTQVILDTIAKHNARCDRNVIQPVQATFFVTVSHIREDDRILEQMQADGHEIGNHGFVDDTVVFEHSDLFRLQFQASHRALLSHGLQTIRWYRPARAFYNSAMVRTVQCAQGYERHVALASMVPIDASDSWLGHPTVTQWNLNLSIFPGAILLLHGGTPQRSRHTAEVLERVLPKLDRLGYSVVTLSQLYDGIAS